MKSEETLRQNEKERQGAKTKRVQVDCKKKSQIFVFSQPVKISASYSELIRIQLTLGNGCVCFFCGCV